jgi:putative two-component system response regulator
MQLSNDSSPENPVHTSAIWRQLEEELCLANAQTLRYARDLQRIYSESKAKKRELGAANSQLTKYAVDLRTTVRELRETNRELREAYQDTIQRLVMAAEYKDKETGNHITRISRYSSFLADRCGMSRIDVENMPYAASMHDIGKIGIPDNILLKRGHLTPEEFDLMKTHTLIGANILDHSRAKVLILAHEIALSHHEKWNGTGYPEKRREEEIPLAARIVSLVDTFDALTSNRPYKRAYPVDIACDIIRRERERHFDPELAGLFLSSIDEIMRIRNETSDIAEYSDDSFQWSDRDLRQLHDASGD